MVREQIRKDLTKACQKLGLFCDKIIIDYPPDSKFGDYTTNLALQQQKQSIDKGWQTPIETAKKIVEALGKKDYLEKIEVAEPGFINFYLSKSFLQLQVGQILEKKEKFAQLEVGLGKKARVEFVSANPTGPLHIGNARGGPVGDTIAEILKTAGYKVLREYLHNDIGGQVDKLGQTLINLQKGEKLEKQEYKGRYLLELLKKIGKTDNPKTAAAKAAKIMLSEILEDCGNMGIKFDKVYFESEIEQKNTNKVLEKLAKKGVLKQQENAIWFAPSDEYLKDREAVVVKSNGEKTYFANDIAYHDLKFSAGFDLVVNELGSGHDGHIPKLKSAISLLGYNLEKFKVIVHQNVRVKRGRKIIKMSKRAGNFVTAREVLNEVGKDVFRFFMLANNVTTHLDFDLEQAKKKSSDNPVYYVQYAHARAGSILRRANFKFQISNLKFSLLNHPAEFTLIRQLVKLPELIEDLSRNFQVHSLPDYAITTATLFHKFYEQCRVISKDEKLTKQRLSLVLATRIILSQTLKLMGISAPEKM